MTTAAALGKKPKEFLRTTGINYTTFTLLLEKVGSYVALQKKQFPLSQRGRKSGYSLSQALLLTLLYMRQYPTFLSLGQAFGMSESYAYKRYCYIRRILVQVLNMPEGNLLTSARLTKVAVDVSEQPIERPVKKQQEYYSGKKKAHSKGFIAGLSAHRTDSLGSLRERAGA